MSNEEHGKLVRSVSLLSGRDYEDLRLAGVFSDVPTAMSIKCHKLLSKYFHSRTAKKLMMPLAYSPVWSYWSPIGCLPRWWIGECSPDMEGTGEIKYPGQTKTSTAAPAVYREICRG